MTITVVLGMHRSGTSALSKLLTQLGLTAGDCLLPANEHNADGHFEDTDVLAIDEAVLKRLGTVWHLPLSPERLTQALAQGDLSVELQQAAALIRDRVTRYPNWFVKEPRLSILMPFWQRVFDEQKIRVRYVWMIRHPAQVDASLRARDQLGFIHNTQTWLCYQLAILTAIQGQKTYLLDYETLLGSDTAWLASFSEFLGLSSDQEQHRTAVEKSISKDLHRQRTLTFDGSTPAFRLYVDLKQSSANELGEEKAKAFDLRWSAFGQGLYAPWEWASELDLKNRDLLVRVRDLGESDADSRARVHAAETELQAARAEIERIAGELTTTQQSLEHANVEVTELTESIGQANLQVAELTQKRADLQDQVFALTARANQLSSNLEGLTTEFLTARELLKQAERGISEREDQLDLVLNSMSWKLTKPLRMLKKLFTGR